MKHYLPFLFILLGFGSTSLDAQISDFAQSQLHALDLKIHQRVAIDPALAKTQVNLPSSALGFNWDSLAMDWDSTFRFAYDYQNGITIPRQFTREFKNQGVWENQIRDTENWDQMGNSILFVRERWTAGQWDTTLVTSQDYDLSGNVLKILILLDGGGGLDTLLYETHHYTYTMAGEIATDSIRVQSQWTQEQVNWEKRLYAYDSNDELTTYQLLSWGTSSWDTLFRRRDYVWFDYASGKAESFVHDNYNGGLWSPVQKEEWTWDADGGYVYLRSNYNGQTMDFDPSRREIVDNDAEGNLRLDEQSIWNDSLQAWELYVGNRYLNTYDASNTLTSYLQEFKPYDRPMYSNFYLHQYMSFFVGSNDPIGHEQFAHWATHPVGQSANLLVDVEHPGVLELEIWDLEGKKVGGFALRQPEGMQSHSLELGLSPALYFYRIRFDGKIQSGKLLVR